MPRASWPSRCGIAPQLLCVWLSAFLLAQKACYVNSCTTIGVTAKASSDGSTMVTHTNDCAQCDSRVAYIPARDWPAGTKRPIYKAKLDYPREISNRSETYRPVGGQQTPIPSGYIPEVEHTFGYWEAIYGYLNEHGLGLGESTTAANFPVSRTNLTALFWIRPLTLVVMERCRTARCAVDTMGSLAETYGFYGEDPGASGAGECLILADGREVWVFEITGDPTGKSAFWAAARVQDGHVVASANNFVIREINCDDTENFRCSTDLLARAQKAGVWDGKGAFDWMGVMAPDIRAFSYTPGYAPIPMYTTARLWRLFSRVSPSSGVMLTDNQYALPFSVHADAPLTHRQLMDLYRDHYEGTKIDLTLGPLAGPFGSPNRMEGGLGLKVLGGQFARSLSLPRTSYALVIQSFIEKHAGALDKMWFASDAPASSVFVPFYTNVSGFSSSYRIGQMAEYDDRSAWWVFDFVANWMDLNYRLMSIDVKAKIATLQDLIDEHREPMEATASKLLASGQTRQALERLADFQTDLQERVVDTWRKFGHFLIMKYNDGHLNYPTVAAQIGYPGWWLQTFNVDSNIRPKWGQPSATAPSFFELYGPGPFEHMLPQVNMAASAVYNGVSAPLAWVSAAGVWGMAVQYVAVFAVGWLAGTRGILSWCSFPWNCKARALSPPLAAPGCCDHYSDYYVAAPSA